MWNNPEVVKILVGQTEDHVEPWEISGRMIHKDMTPSLLNLAEAARKDGFDLKVASGFRSFQGQLNIWNGKVRGERPVLNDTGEPLNAKTLAPRDLIRKILRWSALPGASRHHWGTDIDVFDAAAMPEGYQLQLTVEESNSLFKNFHLWLDENINRFGFYRPYDQDRGGVSPEPWHISFAEISQPLTEMHSEELLEFVLQSSEIDLKMNILEELPWIFSNYFTNISTPR